MPADVNLQSKCVCAGLDLRGNLPALTGHGLSAGAPGLPPSWRWMTLALLILCLGMLIGLTVLGSMYSRQQALLQQITQKYCQELSSKPGGHKCSSCDHNWRFHGGKCYGSFKNNKTWEESKKYCDDRNSTLLKIGHSRSLEGSPGSWEHAKKRFELLGDGDEGKHCASIRKKKISTTFCRELHYYICEKVGIVKVDQLV
ncbi:C-type lectin domain family 1 member B-like [Ornithorhynchus anatinus]|uniref:C-type lectin domain family 1 member B-like n=1 Tax=Ornithorhynchus anatinus TaxID=9258 RepID=UPI0019D41F02|nr:C-type lectin domain family 1 member B-like [Ornithorhynchus anatinus]